MWNELAILCLHRGFLGVIFCYLAFSATWSQACQIIKGLYIVEQYILSDRAIFKETEKVWSIKIILVAK